MAILDQLLDQRCFPAPRKPEIISIFVIPITFFPVPLQYSQRLLV